MSSVPQQQRVKDLLVTTIARLAPRVRFEQDHLRRWLRMPMNVASLGTVRGVQYGAVIQGSIELAVEQGLVKFAGNNLIERTRTPIQEGPDDQEEVGKEKRLVERLMAIIDPYHDRSVRADEPIMDGSSMQEDPGITKAIQDPNNFVISKEAEKDYLRHASGIDDLE